MLSRDHVCMPVGVVCISAVLAVGHTDGTVGLHDVENGRLLNSFKTSSPVTSLRWTKLDQER